MNKILNKFLLAGDKFMLEMHLKQRGCTYSACGPFPKNKERVQKFKETGNSSYIYKWTFMKLHWSYKWSYTYKFTFINELDKACFQHDMA